MSQTEQVQRARTLVLRYGWNTMSYQILNPGMQLWFTPDGDAVVGYVAAAGYYVVAGAPVCASEELAAVSSAFEAEARRKGWRVCYFGAQERLTDLLAAHGPTARLLLGAQPVWHPANWEAIVARKASLRSQLARARNKQVQVVQWKAAQATDNPDLQRCLCEWLLTRGLPPMHFLVEPETLARLDGRRIYVAEHQRAVVGFLIASPVPLRHGWLIEQIVRGRHAPNGTVELLLDAAMRDLTAAHYVTLGLAPLSEQARVRQPPQPFVVRALLALVRAHGRRFYNFAGLDSFKAKFQPEEWEPVYAVASERQTSLRMIYAIAAAFSGESPVTFVSRALLRALAQETRWFAQRLVGVKRC